MDNGYAPVYWPGVIFLLSVAAVLIGTITASYIKKKIDKKKGRKDYDYPAGWFE